MQDTDIKSMAAEIAAHFDAAEKESAAGRARLADLHAAMVERDRAAEATATAPRALTVDQAAAYLNVSRTYLYGLMRGHELRPFYEGARPKFLTAALDDYLERKAGWRAAG